MDKLDEIPYMEFLDYKTGTKYPHRGSLEPHDYWKDMKSLLEEYLEHKESKLEGDVGILQKRHLVIDRNSIRYIGKESNELEQSQVFGASKEDTIQYENQQKKLREIISNLTLERALEIGISRRTYFDWKKKIREGREVILKNKLKEKIISKIFEMN